MQTRWYILNVMCSILNMNFKLNYIIVWLPVADATVTLLHFHKLQLMVVIVDMALYYKAQRSLFTCRILDSCYSFFYVNPTRKMIGTLVLDTIWVQTLVRLVDIRKIMCQYEYAIISNNFVEIKFKHIHWYSKKPRVLIDLSYTKKLIFFRLCYIKSIKSKSLNVT